MHGDTDKEAQVSRGSLVSRSSLAVRCAQAGVCFTLSHRRRSQSCSYLHYAHHLNNSENVPSLEILP